MHRSTLGSMALTALALVAPAAPAADPAPDVTVMSRNLYLGGSIGSLVAARDVAGEMRAAAAFRAMVDRTSFRIRARAIAAEVKATLPDVIGLQEVARYSEDAAPPADDWLALLQQRLEARGLSYRAVSREDDTDLSVPLAGGHHLHIVVGNVVLVRSGRGAHVTFLRDVHGAFAHQLSMPLADGTVLDLKRGFAGMDGRVAGRRFRFLDVHTDTARYAALVSRQFADLLRTVARSKRLPTIIAGDFNSGPTSSGAGSAGYRRVIRAGFAETGRRAGTCCQSANLRNRVPTLHGWIDHIVVRPRTRVLKSFVIGARPADRINGLWPSDHAGLVATLRLT